MEVIILLPYLLMTLDIQISLYVCPLIPVGGEDHSLLHTVVLLKSCMKIERSLLAGPPAGFGIIRLTILPVKPVKIVVEKCLEGNPRAKLSENHRYNCREIAEPEAFFKARE